MTTLSDQVAAALPAWDHFTQAEVEHPDWDAAVKPYVVHQPPTWRPTVRPLAGSARQQALTWIFRCVSNDAAHAADMARAVVDVTDGYLIGGSLVKASVPHSTPIGDPTMTFGFRWSVTVEASYWLPRGVTDPNSTATTDYSSLIP